MPASKLLLEALQALLLMRNSLDDFMRGIDAWSSEWLHRNWQSPIRETLLFTYSYLRLYLNSFAFSATLMRAPSLADEEGPAPVFKDGIGKLPDGRFITNAVEAACSLVRECESTFKLACPVSEACISFRKCTPRFFDLHASALPLVPCICSRVPPEGEAMFDTLRSH